MKRIRSGWQVAYQSFWLLPGAGVVTGIVLGLALPSVDESLGFDPRLPFFSFEDPGAARGLLETIATVTVSVAGISFSVTVVALQLASQQLSPRVLRTFQNDRLSQTTLALFLGTFVYALLVLAAFRVSEDEVPKLSVAVAVVAATAAFLLFVAFIHNIVGSLQASTLIRRMAADGHRTAAAAYPAGVGTEPEDPAAAERLLAERCQRDRALVVSAVRAGYLITVDGAAVVEAATEANGVVLQRAGVGEFVVTDEPLAQVVVGDVEDPDTLIDRIRDAFQQSQERTIEQDIAFPIRQLADVALRALSPSVNDPTTAENAMGSVADTLIVFARGRRPALLRVDEGGQPRFRTRAPGLDDLTRLGFDQVRQHAAAHPLLATRLIELLMRVRDAGRSAGLACTEAERQIRLIGEGVAENDLPTPEDAEQVRDAARAARTSTGS